MLPGRAGMVRYVCRAVIRTSVSALRDSLAHRARTTSSSATVIRANTANVTTHMEVTSKSTYIHLLYTLTTTQY